MGDSPWQDHDPEELDEVADGPTVESKEVKGRENLLDRKPLMFQHRLTKEALKNEPVPAKLLSSAERWASEKVMKAMPELCKTCSLAKTVGNTEKSVYDESIIVGIRVTCTSRQCVKSMNLEVRPIRVTSRRIKPAKESVVPEVVAEVPRTTYGDW